MPRHALVPQISKPALPASCLLACLVLASCAGGPGTRTTSGPSLPTRAAPHPPAAAMRPACVDCGRVERIERVAAIRATASGGAVLGGVVGGVISAPAPGAPANASASGAPRPPQGAWRIHLRMDDGRRLVVHQNLIAAGLAVGSRVRLVQGRLVPVH